MKDITYELQQILNESKNDKEYKLPNPIKMCKTELDMNKVIEDYLLLTNEERKKNEISQNPNIEWLLMSFCVSMATYSLRLSEQKYFTNGLTALGMVYTLSVLPETSKVFDIRDILRHLVLYWDVHKKKNLSFQPVLDQNDEFSIVLKKFIERDEVNKTLKCMGFTIIGEGDNVEYKSTLRG